MTLEYYDQPQPIKLLYEGANGRRIGIWHTPDFFVLREDSAGWEEWKTPQDLVRLAGHNANRYQLIDGQWRCPPGEEYASQFGLFYRVRSSDEIVWMLQRNLQFLDDYFRADIALVPATVSQRVLSYVTGLRAVTLRDLIEITTGTATRDQIFFLIADDTLYVDLCRAPLVDPENVMVYSSREASLQSEPIRSARQLPLLSIPQTFEAGGRLSWDGRPWQIANIGEHLVWLVGESGTVTELPVGEAVKVAAHSLVEGTGFDLVQLSKVGIEHDFSAAHDVDAPVNELCGRRQLGGRG